MENNSFLLKLTRSKIVFIILLIMIIFLNIANNYVINTIFKEIRPDFSIKANGLYENQQNLSPLTD